MNHGHVAELAAVATGTCHRRQPDHPSGTMAVRLRWLADMCDRLPESAEAGERLDPALETWLSRIADLVLPAPPAAFGESALVAVQAHEPRDRISVPRARSSAIEVVVLGRFAVIVNGADATPVRGNGAMLVKLLALRGAATPDDVIDRLWPDVSAVVGHARLRNTLSRLRKTSGDVVVRNNGLLVINRDARVDAAEFLTAARTATSGQRAGRVDAARLAIDLFGGELLPGDRYAPWFDDVREHVRCQFLAVVDVASRDAEQTGDLHEAIHLLEMAQVVDPFDEAVATRTAELLFTLGRPVGARRALDRAWWISKELGVPPSGELIELTDRIIDRAAVRALESGTDGAGRYSSAKASGSRASSTRVRTPSLR